MKAKILELMQREGLKPGQLAELLDISPAVISHILSERNKPSLDLLCKILRRFPQINPDWLLLDSPHMYRSDVPARENTSSAAATGSAADENTNRTFQGGLFDIAEAMSAHQPAAGRSAAPQGNIPGFGSGQSVGGPDVRTDRNAVSPGAETYGPTRQSEVARVVICYTDGTCESYLPTMR